LKEKQKAIMAEEEVVEEIMAEAIMAEATMACTWRRKQQWRRQRQGEEGGIPPE
jgi:hypothetical protein